MTLIKWVFKPLAIPIPGSLALLFLRVVVGIAFLYHGWGKITNPFAWMGDEAKVPGILQSLAALSEFGGGSALILGAITPLAMLGIAFTMAVATYTHAIVMEDPFVNMTGGTSYEPALVYFAIALLMITIGPGKFSIDAMLFGTRNPLESAPHPPKQHSSGGVLD